MPSSRTFAHALCILCVGVLPAVPAGAQEHATSPDTQAESGPLVLSPVKVTARKREELLIDVPIAATVVRPGNTTLSSFDSAGSISRAVPNFTINDSGNTRLTFGSIRGVGILTQPLSPVDTAVGWAIDGTVQPTFGSNSQLLDMERIEVLRGPQNTLFGRGTQGGAVNLVTRRPSFDREFALASEIGESEYRQVDAVANGALLPGLAAGRLAVRYSSYGGDIENISTGGQDGETDLGAARASLLLTPNQRTTAILRGYYEDDRRDTPAFLLRDSSDFPGSAITPENRLDRRLVNASLEIEHDFDKVLLTSVSSFHSNKQEFTSDLSDGLIFGALTGLPTSAFDTPGQSERRAEISETAFQQELRLSSLGSSDVQWLVGGNLYYSDLELDGNDRDPLSPFNNGLVDTSIDTLSYAAFGEAGFPLFGPLSGTVGLRVGRDEQDLESLFISRGNPGIVPRFAEEGRFEDTYVVGGASLTYSISPSHNVYTSVRRGHTTGGFATLNRNQFFGQPQDARPASESWTYEVGAKLEFWDGRLRLDGAAFFNDIEDAALISFDPGQSLSVPVPLNYESYGFELEGAAQLGAGFTLRGGVGFTEAEFVDVEEGDISGARDGEQVPNVPRWTTSLSLENSTPVSLVGEDPEVLGRFEWQYSGERAADVSNSFTLDSYHVLNAQVGVAFDGVSFYGFARNLTDERFETLGVRFGPEVEAVSVGRGRVLGISASLRF
ncbi:TonB-dependent receptor [Algihabitans albus]|uniref:TonB-dependent receptor n=1 Tax=Algihabitans albus TaxID=2164067 RepID=UPI000E5CCB41|nr:TonB-dependent receptor [Algihabitans albus]